MNKLLPILAVGTTVLTAYGQQKNRLSEHPNILIILADDAGYADFGFMGSKDIETPNLDKLASDGRIFTDAHASGTVSSPSRAMIMTRRYGQCFGYECNTAHDWE